MAFTEAIKAFQRGDGFEKSFGLLWVSQDEIDRGRLLDSKLDVVNRNSFERGLWTSAEYDKIRERAAAGATDQLFLNPDSSPWQGFKEGASEGLEAVQDGIKTTLSAPIKFTFGSIPWQIWALVAAYVAWKLGAFDKLKT